MTDKELNDFIENLVQTETDQDAIFLAISKETGQGILKSIRIHTQFMKETGRILNTEQKKEKTLELTKARIVDGEINDFDALSAEVATALNISEASALANVKKACEGLDIPVPAKQAATGEVNAWLIANPNTSKENFFGWMEETKRKASTATAYWAQFMFAKKCFTAWSNA